MISSISHFLEQLANKDSSTEFSPSSLKQKINEVSHAIFNVLGFMVAAAGDLATLPLGGVVLGIEGVMGHLKKDFNPKPEDAKIGKTAIVLLHGSGFCQAQWNLARLFLNKDEFGSVYSLNYAEGLISNNPKSGIEDYAGGEKLRNLMAKIKEDTKQNRIIIIGHSMGSLVGECFAQNHADKLGIEVPHLLSISSPWQGAPAVDLFKFKARRLQEMSQISGDSEYIAFRKNLVKEALNAEKTGKRLQWNIWSKHDLAVPGKTGRLTKETSRQYEVFGIGHYNPMASIRVLSKMQAWIKQMYQAEK